LKIAASALIKLNVGSSASLDSDSLSAVAQVKVDELWNAFLRSISDACDNSMPVAKSGVSANATPWWRFHAGLSQLKKTYLKLRRLEKSKSAKRSDSANSCSYEGLKAAAKSAENRWKHAVRAAKRRYFASEISKINASKRVSGREYSRTLWSVFHRMSAGLQSASLLRANPSKSLSCARYRVSVLLQLSL
jgi:hypothetical protein